MAYGGLPETKNVWETKNGLTIVLECCSYENISAEALVCGEGTSLGGRGHISRSLLSHGGEKYYKARCQLKQKHNNIFVTENVYHLQFRQLKYKHILYAIVPPFVKAVPDKWRCSMKKLYRNVLYKADDLKMKNIVLPLLGCGKSQGPVAELTSILMNVLCSEKTINLKSVLVVTLNKEAAAYIESSIQSLNKMDVTKPNSKHDNKTATSTTAKQVAQKPDNGMKPKEKQTKINHTQDSQKGDSSFPEEKTRLHKSSDQSTSDFDSDDDDQHLSQTSDINNDDSDEELICVICMDVPNTPKTLHKCGHTFCTDCIDKSFSTFKSACPTCNMVYGTLIGTMPHGSMTKTNERYPSLPGYEGHGMIVITYSFQDGVQSDKHPHPGRMYRGTTRVAYLPDNSEGRLVYRLLQISYERKLTFTVGRSNTTGCDDVVTWNDIHHKTSTSGGATGFGYPDPDYLRRVREELASKGITEKDY